MDYEIERNWRSDLEVNSNNLEEEWIIQPSLYMYYSEKYANAVLERDKSKRDLELVEAKLDLFIHQNWETEFSKQPSELLRRDYVISQSEYKEKLDLLINANYKVNLLQSAKNAFEHRKKALEQIVTMNITGYHSEPKIKVKPKERSHVGLKRNAVIRKTRT